jgi:hypothetical protein
MRLAARHAVDEVLKKRRPVLGGQLKNQLAGRMLEKFRRHIDGQHGEGEALAPGVSFQVGFQHRVGYELLPAIQHPIGRRRHVKPGFDGLVIGMQGFAGNQRKLGAHVRRAGDGQGDVAERALTAPPVIVIQVKEKFLNPLGNVAPGQLIGRHFRASRTCNQERSCKHTGPAKGQHRERLGTGKFIARAPMKLTIWLMPP